MFLRHCKQAFAVLSVPQERQQIKDIESIPTVGTQCHQTCKDVDENEIGSSSNNDGDGDGNESGRKAIGVD